MRPMTGFTGNRKDGIISYLVLCGDQLLVSYLRRCNQDAAKHAWAILVLRVKRFRQQWPEVKILFRGDSGFCRHKLMAWCERHDVGYILGIGRNERIMPLSQPWLTQAERPFEATGEKQRVFGEFRYGAESWKKGKQRIKRRVIVKAERLVTKANPRYIVTNLPGEPQPLYEQVYCARGKWRMRSSNSNSTCLPIVPAVMGGGPTRSGCCCPKSQLLDFG